MKKIMTVISLLALFACNETKINESNAKSHTVGLDQANWFLGIWQNSTPDGVFTERWEQKNDSLYLGNSTVVVGKDTVFYESIDLQKTNNDWKYIVSVKNQASSTSASNNEQPVSFKLTSVTPTQLVFENPQHDFPTKIIYTQINNDSIVAEISGIIKGVEKKELFPMKRIK